MRNRALDLYIKAEPSLSILHGENGSNYCIIDLRKRMEIAKFAIAKIIKELEYRKKQYVGSSLGFLGFSKEAYSEKQLQETIDIFNEIISNEKLHEHGNFLRYIASSSRSSVFEFCQHSYQSIQGRGIKHEKGKINYEENVSYTLWMEDSENGFFYIVISPKVCKNSYGYIPKEQGTYKKTKAKILIKVKKNTGELSVFKVREIGSMHNDKDISVILAELKFQNDDNIILINKNIDKDGDGKKSSQTPRILVLDLGINGYEYIKGSHPVLNPANVSAYDIVISLFNEVDKLHNRRHKGKKGFVHYDIKLQNVCISNDENSGELKLSLLDYNSHHPIGEKSEDLKIITDRYYCAFTSFYIFKDKKYYRRSSTQHQKNSLVNDVSGFLYTLYALIYPDFYIQDQKTMPEKDILRDSQEIQDNVASFYASMSEDKRQENFILSTAVAGVFLALHKIYSEGGGNTFCKDDEYNISGIKALEEMGFNSMGAVISFIDIAHFYQKSKGFCKGYSREEIRRIIKEKDFPKQLDEIILLYKKDILLS